MFCFAPPPSMTRGLLSLFLSGPSAAVRDGGRRCPASVRVTFQLGHSTLDSEREGAPGVRTELRLPHRHRRPPDNRRSNPTGRLVSLLRHGERRLCSGLSLHGESSHRSILRCGAHRHGRPHSGLRADPFLHRHPHRATAAFISGSSASWSRVPDLPAHGGHLHLPGGGSRRALPGADGGAALRELLHQTGRSEPQVLPAGSAGPGGVREKAELPPGTQNHLQPLQRPPGPSLHLRADLRHLPPDRPRRGSDVSGQDAPASAAASQPAPAPQRGLRQRAVGHAAQRPEEDEREQLRAAEAGRPRGHVAALPLLHGGAQPDPGAEEPHAAAPAARRELHLGAPLPEPRDNEAARVFQQKLRYVCPTTNARTNKNLGAFMRKPHRKL